MTAIIKLTGTLAGIAGALLVALNIAASGLGFVFFLASSICWLAAAMRMKDAPLAWLNFVFCLINLLGIYRWIFA